MERDISYIIQKCINCETLSSRELEKLQELIDKSRAGHHLALNKEQQHTVIGGFSDYDCAENPEATLLFLEKQKNPIVIDFTLNYPNLGSRFGLIGTREEYLKVFNNPMLLDIVLNGPIFYGREQGITPIRDNKEKQNVIKSLASIARTELERGIVGPYANVLLNTINTHDSIHIFQDISQEDFDFLIELYSQRKLSTTQSEALTKMRLFSDLRNIESKLPAEGLNKKERQQIAMNRLCMDKPEIVIVFKNKTIKGKDFCNKNITSKEARDNLENYEGKLLADYSYIKLSCNTSIDELNETNNSGKIKEEKRRIKMGILETLSKSREDLEVFFASEQLEELGL